MNPPTTIRQGGLGVSLRSKAPIFNDAGQVIGIVSVGYLTSYLDTVTLSKAINIFIAAVLLLAALFIFLWFFTRSIKKQIFSLEPREIGLLVRQQKAMMESIYEGVIAIDSNLRIEVINQAARTLLSLNQPTRELRGQLITEVIPPVSFFSRNAMLEKDTHDEIGRFNHVTVIASPLWPEKGFASLEEARAWVESFVGWYNEEHRHSGIRYVTPGQRHRGEDSQLLAKRKSVYEAAKMQAPHRWSGATRNWRRQEEVWLNPERETRAA